MSAEIEGLKKLLKRKRLDNLIPELENDPECLEDWKKRTKEDWKEIVGIAPGVDIFNYLNPATKLKEFLANSLENIEKALVKPSTTGTKRANPKSPKYVERWKEFKNDAANFDYPTTVIGNDISLPVTRGIEIKLESDVNGIVKTHLDNFNRIFIDQEKTLRFASKADVFPTTLEAIQIEESVKFIGVPDHVLILGAKVLSFVEDKTPNDLPVRHPETKQPFELLEMYKEDINYQNNNRTREDIGRIEVLTVIDQVYGYIALNNLIYGCVTCYDVTYFLWRPKRGTLLISEPVYNDSPSPTLLQALYYFAHLVIQGHDNEQQKLEPSPKDGDLPIEHVIMEADESSSQGQSDSGSNYSSQGKNKRAKNELNIDPLKYTLNLDSLRFGTYIGEGATGQVIRLKNSDIVVKCCDSYNNPYGFKMLQNEISIYQNLSKLDLVYIPRYYGECEIHGQYFIALEFIPGKPCDWRADSALTKKLKSCLNDLKSRGVTHHDLRPDNVLLTSQRDIKLIDFGKAELRTRME